MAAEDLKNKPNQGPKAHQGDLDLQAIVEQQSKELAELRAILMATIQSQPKVTPDSIWAKQHEKEMAIKADLDRFAALFLEKAKDRSQWEANKLNPDGKRLFKVSVGWCPELVMRANDSVTAKAYYDQACGINSVTMNANKPESTTYAIADVTDDPWAQKRVNNNWAYQAAA